MDTITVILEWIEYNEFLEKYCWVGIFLAAAIVTVCVWKWLTRDIG